MGMKKGREDVSGPWGISIRTSKKSIMKVIPREFIGEDVRDVLSRAKRFAKAIREKYEHRDDVVVEIISRSHAFPKPRDKKAGRNELWCPYCGKFRRFKRNQMIYIDGIEFVSETNRCIICQMSDTDYWVRTYNDTWPLRTPPQKKKKG